MHNMVFQTISGRARSLVEENQTLKPKQPIKQQQKIYIAETQKNSFAFLDLFIPQSS